MRFNDEDGQDDEAVIEVRGQEEKRKDRIQRMWTQMNDGSRGVGEVSLQQMGRLFLCCRKGWGGFRWTERANTAGLTSKEENNISPSSPIGDFPRDEDQSSGREWICLWLKMFLGLIAAAFLCLYWPNIHLYYTFLFYLSLDLPSKSN